MSATTTLDSLRAALAGEHTQLESWVRESFSAMDALHDELAEWQRELARQEAALDQRAAALTERSASLKTEGDSTAELHGEILAELRELRQTVDRQGALLEALTGDRKGA